MCFICEREKAMQTEEEFEEFEEMTTFEAVEILCMIRASACNGQRSAYTDDIVEAIDALYLEITESLEVV